MKKYLLIILCAITIISCEDLVDVQPKSNYTFANFWNNEAEATAGIMSIYNQMQTTFMNNYAMWGDARCDYIDLYNTIDQQVVLLNNQSLTPGLSSADWSGLYKIISRSNFALKNIPLVKDGSFLSGKRLNLKGEAFFSRALAYFYIVRIWGDAPLVLEPYDNSTLENQVARDPAEKIWKQIVADLDSAGKYLPSDYGSNESSYNFTNYRNNRGRATKCAAYAVQTDVFMSLPTPNYFKADSVFNLLKGFSRYYVSPNTTYPTGWKLWQNATNTGYGDLLMRRDAAVTYPSEGIFEIQFNYPTEKQRSNMSNLWHSNNNTMCPSDEFYMLFEATDSRRNYYSTKSYNGNFCKIFKFLGPTYGAFQVAPANNFDQNIVLYRLADVMLLTAEAKNQLGDKAGAVALLNEVRRRAYAPNVAPKQAAAVSTEELQNIILTERAKELLGEGKRWFDLVRTNKETLAGVTDGKDGVVWPIYYNHLVANKKLKQNRKYGTGDSE